MRMIKLGYVILKCFANYKSMQSVVTFAKKELEITDFLFTTLPPFTGHLAVPRCPLLFPTSSFPG